MLTPPRLGVVLGVLQLLLLVTSSDDHRLSSAADHRPPPAVTDHRPPPAVTDHRPPPSAQLAPDTNSISRQDTVVRDCSDLPYGSPSGEYEIKPDLLVPNIAYCDMSDGVGWTVFQRRADLHPRRNFLLDWEPYKWGFGTLDQDFWWGLHFLWELTAHLDRIYELRVDLWDWEGETRYATYQNFTIASAADGYRLNFTGYAGDAGDALDYHNGMKFSTFDRDNDPDSRNCAAQYTGAWWYNGCFHSNLNGLYSPDTTAIDGVVSWRQWRDDWYSLNATTMKIRPTKKL